MQNNRKNLMILFFTMIVVMLGFGMIIPIMPFYIKSFGASGSAMGGLMAIYGFLQFVFSPIWGGLSDRIGRKPVLMIGVLGNAIAQLLFGLSTELWMLFAARALAGLLSSATLPTAMAYIGDSTEDKDRSGGMGIIGAAMGLGMVLGPGLAGVLAERSLSLPFLLASALSLLALGLVFFLLPEPERKSHPVTEAAKRLSRLGQMIQALGGPLGVLFLMTFLLTFGLTNFESVFGLYSVDRYSYTPKQVGLVLTTIGLISALMQGTATGPLTRRFGEVKIIHLALLGSAVGFVLMTLPDSMPGVLLTTGFYTFSNAMLNPAVQALISRQARAGQGITMGMSNSFQSLGRIVGPLYAGNIYDLGMNLPYLSGAAIMAAGLLVSLIWLKKEPVSG